MSPVWYFGCMNRVGHYMHRKPNLPGLTGARTIENFTSLNPWGVKIDGGLCPPCRDVKGQIEGMAVIHYKDGWTAMAFWDRSIDCRGASNSVFLCEGLHDFAEMMRLAREAFPQVFARFKFEVVEISQ